MNLEKNKILDDMKDILDSSSMVLNTITEDDIIETASAELRHLNYPEDLIDWIIQVYKDMWEAINELYEKFPKNLKDYDSAFEIIYIGFIKKIKVAIKKWQMKLFLKKKFSFSQSAINWAMEKIDGKILAKPTLSHNLLISGDEYQCIL